MKKLKLLGLVGLMMIFSSCHFSTVPIEIIEPKLNGIKISLSIKNENSLSIDSKENLYFNEKNTIKKMDSKGNVSIIGGKEIPDIFPEDGNIDGDVNSAKFGEIEKSQYFEEENTIYIEEKFNYSKLSIDGYYYLVRKIKNNKVETIKNFGLLYDGKNKKLNYINYINKKGDVFYTEFIEGIDKFQQFKMDKNKNLFEIKQYNGNVQDNEDDFYNLYRNTNENYILDFINKDGSTKSILNENQTGRHKINITIDKNNNIYILKDELLTNIDHEIISDYSPIHIYKFTKNEILETKKSLNLDKSNLLCELSEKDRISIRDGIVVSENGLYLYGIDNEFYIKKIYLGGKK